MFDEKWNSGFLAEKRRAEQPAEGAKGEAIRNEGELGRDGEDVGDVGNGGDVVGNKNGDVGNGGNGVGDGCGVGDEDGVGDGCCIGFRWRNNDVISRVLLENLQDPPLRLQVTATETRFFQQLPS